MRLKKKQLAHQNYLCDLFQVGQGTQKDKKIKKNKCHTGEKKHVAKGFGGLGLILAELFKKNHGSSFITWPVIFSGSIHPGLAKNIASEGGSGSDIIRMGIIIMVMQNNCIGARWFFKPVQDTGTILRQLSSGCKLTTMMLLPLGPHPIFC